MNAKTICGMLILAVLCLAAVPAFAADDKTPNKPGALLTAKSLEGKKIVDQNNQSIGDVDQLVINPKTSQIEYIIVKSGSGGMFKGKGDEGALVPWKAFALTDQGLMLKMPADKLNGAPSLKDYGFVALGEQASRDKIYSFYGIQPDPQPAMGGSIQDLRGQGQPQGQQQGQQRSQQPGQQPGQPPAQQQQPAQQPLSQ